MSAGLRRAFAACALALALAAAAAAQTTGEWLRVASDDGEFSAEFPAAYGFFADRDGFSVADGSRNYQLAAMNLLTAFADGTLLRVEAYDAPKSALDVVREQDAQDGDQESEIRADGYKIKQVVRRAGGSYAVARYFHSNDRIYILTAAARSGETPAMKRFFESVVFRPNAKTAPLPPKTIAFAQLAPTPVEFETEPPAKKPDKAPLAPPAAAKDDPEYAKMILLSRPRAAYTDAARRSGETGAVVLRAVFSPQGRIARLAVVETLRFGLLRQAVFAALRIVFLPAEKAGVPVAVTKPIEYRFSIY